MNGLPSDAQAKALEFVNSASSYVLLATIALLAWVASGVEFSNEALRVASMACLTLSVVFGVATLALIPLVQEARRPGQSNFDVEARFLMFGRRSARLKATMLPQYASCSRASFSTSSAWSAEARLQHDPKVGASFPKRSCSSENLHDQFESDRCQGAGPGCGGISKALSTKPIMP